MARSSPPVPSHENRKNDLLSAAQAAVVDVEERSLRRGRRENTPFGRVTFPVLGGLVFGASVYVLTARPDWFFTPDPPAQSTVVETASIRIMLVREAERIRRFRVANGVLPGTLEEAGSPVSGVGYYRSDDSTFRLSVGLPVGELALRSDMSTEEFLGNSLEIINQRGE
ncbi:MAG: hypothetical protein E4G90_08215 [Gemmatimonadales bacterium]|nr:MAG: hypothetical protein E4G90_08215 [Gemmatimonadales bacterium]